MKFDHKRIADPVHGTIELSKPEADVLQTPVFQRLRNIKQLGMAYLVYPGADYSRFSHSVGACHIAAEILDRLDRKGQLQFWSTADKLKNMKLLRLAALLHDVGHYP